MDTPEGVSSATAPTIEPSSHPDGSVFNGDSSQSPNTPSGLAQSATDRSEPKPLTTANENSKSGTTRNKDEPLETPDADGSHATGDTSKSLASSSVDIKDNQKASSEGDDKAKAVQNTKPQDPLTEPISEEKTNEGVKRVNEYAEYLKQMEARVAMLEARFREPVKEEPKKLKDSGARVPAIPELRRVKWTGFMNMTKGDRVYAVDVLFGEEQYWFQRKAPSDDQGPSVSPSEKEVPKRVRINSVPILHVIYQIVWPSLSESTLKENEPIVFIHPFKAFVYHEKEIRSRLAELENKWGQIDRNTIIGTPEKKGMVDLPTQKAKSDDEPIDIPKADNGKVQDSSTSEATEAKVVKEDLTDSLETLRDLRCLVRFMDEDLFPTIPNTQDLTCCRIAFRDLWHLFKPGEQVFIPRPDLATKPGLPEPEERSKGATTQLQRRNSRYQEDWRVISRGEGRVNLSPSETDQEDVKSDALKQTPNAFKIVAFYIDFSDSVFRAVVHPFRIRPFEGMRDITSLEVYPSRYLKNVSDRNASLIARGRKFKELTSFRHMRYEGSTFACHPCGCAFDGDSTPTNAERIESNVMVDFAEALQNDHGWNTYTHQVSKSCINERETTHEMKFKIWKDDERRELDDARYEGFDSEHYEYGRIRDFASSHALLGEDPDPAVASGRDLKEEDLLLLPARVLAYAFRVRRFVALNIEGLKEVEIYKKGWDDLRLPSGHKNMIRGLVGTHLKDRESRPTLEETEKHSYDLVRGKGKQADLFEQLHSNRSQGQGLVVLLHGVPGVGKTSTAESVEGALEDIFHLAQLWDCILLLDEADVFLAERSAQDIKRNSLVSVFLRVLEYYSGILFLTVAGFDEAFKSRIHLPLYFPPLKRKQTLAIWKMNLERTIQRKRGMLDADEEDIMDFAEKHFAKGRKREWNWNGRQIRNAFQTAAALAEFESHNDHHEVPVRSKLRIKHFKLVAQAAEQFDEYIQSIDTLTTATRNLHKGVRNDRFAAEDFEFGHRDPDKLEPSVPARGLGPRQRPSHDEEEGLEAPVRPQPVHSNRTQKARDNQRDSYLPESIPFSQARSPERRQPRQNRQAPHDRPHSTKYFGGYPTPDSASQVVYEDQSQSRRVIADEKRQRTRAPQRSLDPRASLQARRPQPEPEYEEPEHSEDDSEEDDWNGDE
ncbi:MAG: hypothetical protein Q9172_004978 [Xanthocarpia lactea]